MNVCEAAGIIHCNGTARCEVYANGIIQWLMSGGAPSRVEGLQGHQAALGEGGRRAEVSFKAP